MIDGQRVIAVVPARGGSKSVPLKNIKLLGGKPLIAWPIQAAQAVPEIDRIIVSTDDAQIAQVARDCGAEVMDRPPELAGDDSLVIDALRDLITKLRAEGESAQYLVLLEPTCPLRSAADIRDCLGLLADKNRNFDSVATFREAMLNPHRAWKIQDAQPQTFIDGAVPWLPRQQLPPAYQLNGAVYAVKTEMFNAPGSVLLTGKIGAVVMPAERSVDIDDAMDFAWVEFLIKAQGWGAS